MTALRPSHAVGLRELTDELDRWSAFAQGAAEDGQLAQRFARERVHRAQHAARLANDLFESDAVMLEELDSMLDRLRIELDAGLLALERERTRLDATVDRAGRFGEPSRQALADNARRQDLCAAELSHLTQALNRAQAELHLARAGQSHGVARVLRRRSSAMVEEERAQASVREAADRCDDVRVRRHELKLQQRALSAALTAADEEIQSVGTARTRLIDSSEYLRRVSVSLDRARVSCGVARERHLDDAGTARQIATDLRASLAALSSATACQMRGEDLYETTTSEVTAAGEQLRELLDGFGDATREIERIVLGMTEDGT